MVDLWEVGELVPTFEQVDRLAVLTGKPRNYFYQPTRPRTRERPTRGKVAVGNSCLLGATACGPSRHGGGAARGSFGVEVAVDGSAGDAEGFGDLGGCFAIGLAGAGGCQRVRTHDGGPAADPALFTSRS